jgi:Tyosinase C-terminal domain
MSNTSLVQQAIANYIEQQYGGGGLQPTDKGLGPIIPPRLGPGPVIPPGPFIPPLNRRPDASSLAQPAADGAPLHVAKGASPAAATASAVSPVADAARNPSASQGSHPRTAESGEPGRGSPSVAYDWTVRIHVKKYELRKSFTVLIFVGPVPDDPSQWRKASSYVGSHSTFVNGSAVQCANCRAQADVVTEGFVHLNRALGGLSSYEPQVVSPYLRENLHWRVQAVRSCAYSTGLWILTLLLY